MRMIREARLPLGRALLLAGALWLGGCAMASAETVSFESAVAAPTFSQVGKVERGSGPPPQRLTGALSKPPGDGPFPAVVLMHGCAGVTVWNRRWTQRLLDWGYAVLDLDSLTPRGRRNVCERVFAVSPAQRALDAFGAKSFLEGLPDIDPNRIAVLGMSHGAWAALIATRRDSAEELAARPFRATVAFYPWCEGAFESASPLLILIGERDDWTPAGRCEAALPAAAQDPEVILKVYPGAHHGFDFKGLDEVQSGHVVRYDAQAAADAIDRVRSFLGRHLKSGQN